VHINQRTLNTVHGILLMTSQMIINVGGALRIYLMLMNLIRVIWTILYMMKIAL